MGSPDVDNDVKVVKVERVADDVKVVKVVKVERVAEFVRSGPPEKTAVVTLADT